MGRFRFTNKAVDDLTQIWHYTLNEWSERQADSYYQMLIENCREIASNPDSGKSYSGITEGLSGFRSGRHIIFYHRVEEDLIEIIRILHEQMDLKSRIKGK